MLHSIPPTSQTLTAAQALRDIVQTLGEARYLYQHIFILSHGETAE